MKKNSRDKEIKLKKVLFDDQKYYWAPGLWLSFRTSKATKHTHKLTVSQKNTFPSQQKCQRHALSSKHFSHLSSFLSCKTTWKRFFVALIKCVRSLNHEWWTLGLSNSCEYIICRMWRVACTIQYTQSAQMK